MKESYRIFHTNDNQKFYPPDDDIQNFDDYINMNWQFLEGERSIKYMIKKSDFESDAVIVLKCE